MVLYANVKFCPARERSDCGSTRAESRARLTYRKGDCEVCGRSTLESQVNEVVDGYVAAWLDMEMLRHPWSGMQEIGLEVAYNWRLKCK